ncbi:MAG: Rha family transcriptional regulator [Azoarcus sp.]|jgi:phage regulator Rha-like protein|nr:Rha family transcriptional regulator [Azoarcus sp.]
MKPLDLFPETLLVESKGGRIYATSLKVAGHFHKLHRHVSRSIESLIWTLAEPGFHRPKLDGETESHPPKLDGEIDPSDDLSAAFPDLFVPFIYTTERGRSYRAWRITHNGFALLTMGFTGKQALRWKLDFLAAFRALERELAILKERESLALYNLRPRWKAIVERPDLPRAGLIQLTGHKSPGSITACRRRMREVGLLEGRAA